MHILLVLLCAAVLSACATVSEPVTCHAGAWRTSSGKVFILVPSTEGAVRVLTMDGNTARLRPTETGSYEGEWRIHAADCGAERIQVSIPDDGTMEAKRPPLDIRETKFVGMGGVEFAGRLILPAGNETVPLVVFLHGAESYSGRDFYPQPWLLATQGIGAFVYDKRGTGASAGEMTQNFGVLAADAAAALSHARGLAGDRVSRAGYWGGSQGARIATRAAPLFSPDFIVAAFGTAGRPVDEDRDEVLFDLAQRGYGSEVLAKAREVTEATKEIRTSDFTRGFDALTEVRRKYAHEPWFDELGGEYTGDISSRPAWQVRLFGPLFDRGGTVPWSEDSRRYIAAYKGPQLWVLAGADDEAPSGPTLAWLRRLQKQRPQLDVVLYSEATHGIRQFENDASGARILGDYESSYFPLVFGWIKGEGLRGHGEAALIIRSER